MFEYPGIRGSRHFSNLFRTCHIGNAVRWPRTRARAWSPREKETLFIAINLTMPF